MVQTTLAFLIEKLADFGVPNYLHYFNVLMWFFFFFFLVVLVIKSPPANSGDVRDMGSVPVSERSPQGGHGNPLKYSCLENPMDRGA